MPWRGFRLSRNKTAATTSHTATSVPATKATRLSSGDGNSSEGDKWVPLVTQNPDLPESEVAEEDYVRLCRNPKGYPQFGGELKRNPYGQSGSWPEECSPGESHPRDVLATATSLLNFHQALEKDNARSTDGIGNDNTMKEREELESEREGAKRMSKVFATNYPDYVQRVVDVLTENGLKKAKLDRL